MVSKDDIVGKALCLLGRLQGKYGLKPRFHRPPPIMPPRTPSPVGVVTAGLSTIIEEDSGCDLWVGSFVFT